MQFEPTLIGQVHDHLACTCPIKGGSGELNLAPRSPVHSNTGREYKPGLLVAKATIKGFDKPWSILNNSISSGNYVKRYSLEGNPRYIGALKAHRVIRSLFAWRQEF